MASLSPGYGYAGIVVAMLAALNPLGVVPSALFFAAVATGAETMSRQTGVPVFLGDVIQGTSLICMLTRSVHRLSPPPAPADGGLIEAAIGEISIRSCRSASSPP